MSIPVKLDERNNETQRALENYIIQKQAAEQQKQPSTQHIPTMDMIDKQNSQFVYRFYFR